MNLGSSYPSLDGLHLERLCLLQTKELVQFYASSALVKSYLFAGTLQFYSIFNTSLF